MQPKTERFVFLQMHLAKKSNKKNVEEEIIKNHEKGISADTLTETDLSQVVLEHISL